MTKKGVFIEVSNKDIYLEIKNIGERLDSFQKSNEEAHNVIKKTLEEHVKCNAVEHEKMKGVADTMKIVLGGAIAGVLLILGWFWTLILGK
jgi:F0F1-type ATP synthase assembly protein I